MSSKRSRSRSASSRSGPCFNRPMAITTTRINARYHAPRPIRIGSETLDRRGGRVLRPQSLEIVEFAHLGSEYVHDHIAGIDQHPVAIGQALDVDAFDAGFLQGFRDVFRDRADVPV